MVNNMVMLDLYGLWSFCKPYTFTANLKMYIESFLSFNITSASIMSLFTNRGFFLKVSVCITTEHKRRGSGWVYAQSEQ